EYDADARIVREDQGGILLERDYDAAGNCSGLTVEGLGRRTFEHDVRGRLVRFVDFDGTTFRFEHDLLDRCVASHADGITIRYEYSAQGRLASASAIADGITRDVRYEYDAIGRIAARRPPDGRRREYEYDGDGRLQAHRDGPERVPHALSPTGDRLRTSGGETVSYGRGGRLEHVGSGTTFTFDGRGRLAGRSDPAGRLDLHYDGFDRLVRGTSDSGLDVRHVFDATGRRLWKIGPTGSTRFVWDGDTLIAEVPTAGGSTVSYVTVPDAEAPCWMSTGGRRIALLTEPNGYPLVAVAADGTEI